MEGRSLENMSQEDLFSFLDTLENQEDVANIEQMILFIGYTRAGKTTTRLLLQNKENGFQGMIAKDDIPVGIYDSRGEIGDDTGTSCTIDPIQFQLPQLNQVTFVDSPGVQDNRGPIPEMVGMYKLNLLANRATSIKVLLFAPFAAFLSTANKNDRVYPLKLAEKFVSKLANSKGFGIVVTNVDNAYNKTKVLIQIEKCLSNAAKEYAYLDKILDLKGITQNRRAFLIRKPIRAANNIGDILYKEYALLEESSIPSETAHSPPYYSIVCEELIQFCEHLEYSKQKEPFSVILSAETKIALTDRLYPIMVTRIEANVSSTLDNMKDSIDQQILSAENQLKVTLEINRVCALKTVDSFCNQQKHSLKLSQIPSNVLEELQYIFKTSLCKKTLEELKEMELRYKKLLDITQYPNNKLPAAEAFRRFGNFLEKLQISYEKESMNDWISEEYQKQLERIKTKYQDKLEVYKRLCPKYFMKMLAIHKNNFDNLCENQNSLKAAGIESVYNALGLIVTDTMKHSQFFCVVQHEGQMASTFAKDFFLNKIRDFLERKAEYKTDSQFCAQTTEQQLKIVLEVLNQIYENVLIHLDSNVLQENEPLLVSLLECLEYLHGVTNTVQEIDNRKLEEILERLFVIMNSCVENCRIEKAILRQNYLNLDDNATSSIEITLSNIFKHEQKFKLLLFTSKVHQFLSATKPYELISAQKRFLTEEQKKTPEEFQTDASEILKHFSATLTGFPELHPDLEMVVKNKANLAEVSLLNKTLFPDHKKLYWTKDNFLVIETSYYTHPKDKHLHPDFSQFENVFIILSGTLRLNKSFRIKSKLLKNVFITCSKIESSEANSSEIEISAEDSDYNPFQLLSTDFHSTLLDDNKQIKSTRGPNIYIFADTNLTSGCLSVVSRGGSHPLPIYETGEDFVNRFATFVATAKCLALGLGITHFHDLFVTLKDRYLKSMRTESDQIISTRVAVVCFYYIEIIVQLLSLAITSKKNTYCLINSVTSACRGSALFRLTERVDGVSGCCILNCEAVRNVLPDCKPNWTDSISLQTIREQSTSVSKMSKRDAEKFFEKNTMKIIKFTCNSIMYITSQLSGVDVYSSQTNSTHLNESMFCSVGGCRGEIQLLFKEDTGNVKRKVLEKSLSGALWYSTVSQICSGKCGRKLEMALAFHKITDVSEEPHLDSRAALGAMEHNDKAKKLFYELENISKEQFSAVLDEKKESNPKQSVNDKVSLDNAAQLSILKGCYHIKFFALELNREPTQMILKLKDYLNACKDTITFLQESKISSAIFQQQKQFQRSIQQKIIQETEATEVAISDHLAGTRLYFSEQMKKLELDMEAIVKLIKSMRKYEIASAIVQAMDKVVRNSTRHLLPTPVYAGTAVMSTALASLAVFFKPTNKIPEALTKEKQNDFNQLVKETEIMVTSRIQILEISIKSIANLKKSTEQEESLDLLRNARDALIIQIREIEEYQNNKKDGNTTLRFLGNAMHKFGCSSNFKECWLHDTSEIQTKFFAELENLQDKQTDQQLQGKLEILNMDLSLRNLDDKVYDEKKPHSWAP